MELYIPGYFSAKSLNLRGSLEAGTACVAREKGGWLAYQIRKCPGRLSNEFQQNLPTSQRLAFLIREL